MKTSEVESRSTNPSYKGYLIKLFVSLVLSYILILLLDIDWATSIEGLIAFLLTYLSIALISSNYGIRPTSFESETLSPLNYLVENPLMAPNEQIMVNRSFYASPIIDLMSLKISTCQNAENL